MQSMILLLLLPRDIYSIGKWGEEHLGSMGDLFSNLGIQQVLASVHIIHRGQLSIALIKRKPSFQMFIFLVLKRLFPRNIQLTNEEKGLKIGGVSMK